MAEAAVPAAPADGVKAREEVIVSVYICKHILRYISSDIVGQEEEWRVHLFRYVSLGCHSGNFGTSGSRKSHEGPREL